MALAFMSFLFCGITYCTAKRYEWKSLYFLIIAQKS